MEFQINKDYRNFRHSFNNPVAFVKHSIGDVWFGLIVKQCQSSISMNTLFEKDISKYQYRWSVVLTWGNPFYNRVTLLAFNIELNKNCCSASVNFSEIENEKICIIFSSKKKEFCAPLEKQKRKRFSSKAVKFFNNSHVAGSFSR